MAKQIATITAVATVGVVVLLYCIALFAAPEFVHFDGEVGHGCDANNSLCTYNEWLKDCDGGAKKCSFAIYRHKGGKR